MIRRRTLLARAGTAGRRPDDDERRASEGFGVVVVHAAQSMVNALGFGASRTSMGTNVGKGHGVLARVLEGGIPRDGEVLGDPEWLRGGRHPRRRQWPQILLDVTQ